MDDKSMLQKMTIVSEECRKLFFEIAKELGVYRILDWLSAFVRWYNWKLFKKKSSEEWQEECREWLVVMDPDGWDRSPEGWEKSWNEPITKAEFLKRVCYSTIQADHKKVIEWEKK